MKELRVVLMRTFICANETILFVNIALQPRMCLVTQPDVSSYVPNVSVKQTHLHLPSDNVWSICNLYGNNWMSSMRIQYTLEDDTLSSRAKLLTLVHGKASIMFPTTLIFSGGHAICLAPTLPYLSFSSLPGYWNLDARCWMTLFTGHLYSCTLNSLLYMINVAFRLWFVRKYIFTRNTPSFTEYTGMTGRKSTCGTPSPHLDNILLTLKKLPATLFSSYSSFHCERLFWMTLYILTHTYTYTHAYKNIIMNTLMLRICNQGPLKQKTGPSHNLPNQFFAKSRVSE